MASEEESGCPWTSGEQTRAWLCIETASPAQPQVAGTAKLLLDSMQLPLAAEPEQAQERVLGSCILDTNVPLLLTLHRDVKGKQPGLLGWEGSWVLSGLRNRIFHFLRVKLPRPKISLDQLEGGGHKMRPKSPLLWLQCHMYKMGIIILPSVAMEEFGCCSWYPKGGSNQMPTR